MPVMFSDKHVCEKCKQLFEWHYFDLMRQKMTSQFFVIETIPSGTTIAYYCQRSIDNSYNIKVNCPHCDFDNHFTHKPKEDVK